MVKPGTQLACGRVIAARAGEFDRLSPVVQLGTALSG